MRFLSFVAASCALADVALAGGDARHVRKITSPNMERRKRAARSVPRDVSTSNPAAETTYIIPQTAQTDKFKVNGSAIPNVDFDIGETYAGLLPISQDEGAGELYFWFHPSANEQADDEILIWLNGGPGCSSLEGLLQENGKFIWQYGTYKPVENPYNWANLTNIVWIEQPAGTGFSPRGNTPNATNEVEAAEQFLGFWKNFVDTFQLHNRKVFLTGESYAGQYVPYIADAMHNATNTTYFNVDSIMIYDPYITYDVVMNDIPAVPFVDYWAKLFNLNDTFMDHLHEKYESCGYKDFMDLAMTFPPNGTLPTPPDYLGQDDSCRLFNEIYSAAILVNPCWDMYQVATTCPLLWDVLGYPGTIGYQPEGADIYFNRTDVQKVINAPLQEWQECIDGVLDVDNDSPASGLSVLPRVIEKNKRSIIVHAELDFKLILNGTIMAIQNMTWNGAQGFSKPPCDWEDFYVPYHEELNQGSLAGAGNFGKWHTERGLTFSTVVLSGHMVPQYAPSAAYRQLEFLLGRIEDLSVVSDFTTQTGDFGNNATIAMY